MIPSGTPPRIGVFSDHRRRRGCRRISETEGEIAMDRDFTRQVVQAKQVAQATSRAQRAFRHDAPSGITGAAYIAQKRRALRTAVAEAAAFDQVVDPVARDLAARRR
jgi:hypothetical protein